MGTWARAAALGSVIALSLASATKARAQDAIAETAGEAAGIRAERSASIGLWASGGTLLTGGGLATIGHLFPCVGSCGGRPLVVFTGIAAASVGLVLVVIATALGIDAHVRQDRLGGAGVSLRPTVDGLALRF